MNNIELIRKLNSDKRLAHEEWVGLISSFSEEDFQYARSLAGEITRENFGNRIFFRGIIEFSNICKNDCFYCGIRHSNVNTDRYCLTEDEILLCCEEGRRLGYRTFVLQSGECGYCETPQFIGLIKRIKKLYPECAITLSVGECKRETYEAMYNAGADRYLLRHETADSDHYGKLHPAEMSFDNRMRCLNDLKEIGFQTGCGMMVGAPFGSPETLAKDMEFIGDFRPSMVGMGPFLPHTDTPFANYPNGSQKLTLFLLSLTRIMLPNVLLPATTALGSTDENGRIQGILSGCNVVMPNLSPQNVRKNYMLYDNKPETGVSAEEGLELLEIEMESIGRKVVVGRGDHRDYKRSKE